MSHCRVPLVLVLSLVCALRAHASPDAVLARGFDENGVYSFHSIDAVNQYNGNLSVSVPLGGEFRTNGTLSYSFLLAYNSNPWAYRGFSSVNFSPLWNMTPIIIGQDGRQGPSGEPATDAGTESYPAQSNTAGFGWMVTMGELGHYGMSYIAPDGSEHRFESPRLAAPVDAPPDDSSQYWFTQDSSYLRLRKIDDVTREVHFPDGIRKLFRCVSSAAACRDARAVQHWVLDQIADPFGHVLYVQRSVNGIPHSSRPDPGNIWTWTFIESSLGFDGYADRAIDTHVSALNTREVRRHVVRYRVTHPHEMRAEEVIVGLPAKSTNMADGATYTLGYAAANVYREPGNWWALDLNDLRAKLVQPTASKNEWAIPVSLLKTLTLPPNAGSSGPAAGTWTFEHYTGDEAVCESSLAKDQPCIGKLNPGQGKTITISGGRGVVQSPVSGRLKKITIPTGGTIEYTYSGRAFPFKACLALATQREDFGVLGVAERRVTRMVPGSDGVPVAVVDRWKYRGVAVKQVQDGKCRPPREFVSTSVDPDGLTTVSYFSIYRDGEKDGQAWSVNDFSLPFSREESDPTQTSATPGGERRFLSTRVYRCDATLPQFGGWSLDAQPIWGRGVAAPLCGAPLRETYVRYERSAGVRSGSVEVEWVNNRIASESTIHRDPDGVVRAAITDRSDFDGLGNYRQEHSHGVGFSGDRKRVFTAFNPLATYDPATRLTTVRDAAGQVVDKWEKVVDRWLLGLFASRSQSDSANATSGTWYTTLYDFAPDTGRLREQRTLRSTAPPAIGTAPVLDDHDRLIRFIRGAGDDAFTVYTDAEYRGGDFAKVSGAPEYIIREWTKAGTSSGKEYRSAVCAAGTFLTMQTSTVNLATGLQTSMRDTSNGTTSYEYDRSGRITKILPHGHASGKEASTEIVYDPATASGSHVTVRARSGGVDLATTEYFYDTWGRMVQKRWKVPEVTNATSTPPVFATTEARVLYTFDAHGRKTRETVPIAVTATEGAATTWQYDPFGRVVETILPDGSKTTTTYTGVRIARHRTTGIALEGSASSADRGEIFDRHGRLVQADEQSVGAEAVGTSYAYDAHDRLATVAAVVPAGQVPQVRSFVYDPLGNLVEEVVPEVGTIAYSGFDSRGNVHFRSTGDAAFDLSYSYDDAERLTSIHDSSDRLLVAYSFFPPGSAGRSAGKLERAERHNRLGPLFEDDVVITTTFQYDATTGKPAEKRLQGGGLDLRTVYGYEPLGNVASIQYPVCTLACTGTEAPARQLTFSYKERHLTAINGLGLVSYHRNGMYSRIHRLPATTTLVDHQSVTPEGMSRVAEIRVAPRGLARALWSTGAYQYDGAQNISGIGQWVFRYDRVGRLVRSSISRPAAQGELATSQVQQYDRYGNITSIVTDGTPRSFTINPATNRISTTGYLYDGGGNLKQTPDLRTGVAGKFITYTFDPLNMMTHSAGDGFDRSYVYDADNERVAVIDRSNPAAVVERWSIRGFGKEVLRDLTRDKNGFKWARDYVYRDGVLFAQYARRSGGGDELLHVHTDHLGTARLITDTAGKVRDGRTYLPFGMETGAGGVAPADTNRMKFTGHERDDDGTGSQLADLDYMHARYYSPALGRFLSLDPAVNTDSASPQRWNRYAYARNNPIAFVDPDGRREVIAEDLPRRYKEAHAAFASTPIGAAAVAQVQNNPNYTVTIRLATDAEKKKIRGARAIPVAGGTDIVLGSELATARYGSKGIGDTPGHTFAYNYLGQIVVDRAKWNSLYSIAHEYSHALQQMDPGSTRNVLEALQAVPPTVWEIGGTPAMAMLGFLASEAPRLANFFVEVEADLFALKVLDQKATRQNEWINYQRRRTDWSQQSEGVCRVACPEM